MSSTKVRSLVCVVLLLHVCVVSCGQLPPAAVAPPNIEDDDDDGGGGKLSAEVELRTSVPSNECVSYIKGGVVHVQCGEYFLATVNKTGNQQYLVVHRYSSQMPASMPFTQHAAYVRASRDSLGSLMEVKVFLECNDTNFSNQDNQNSPSLYYDLLYLSVDLKSHLIRTDLILATYIEHAVCKSAANASDIQLKMVTPENLSTEMKFFVWNDNGNAVSNMTWILRVTDINPDTRICDFIMLRAAGQFRGYPRDVCKKISSSTFPVHWSKHFDQLFHLDEQPGLVVQIPMIGVNSHFEYESTYLLARLKWNPLHRVFYFKLDKTSPVCVSDYKWVTSEVDTGYLIDLKPPS